MEIFKKTITFCKSKQRKTKEKENKNNLSFSKKHKPYKTTIIQKKQNFVLKKPQHEENN